MTSKKLQGQNDPPLDILGLTTQSIQRLMCRNISILIYWETEERNLCFPGPEIGTVVLHDQDGLNLAYFVARNPEQSANITYHWLSIASAYQNEDMQYVEQKIEFSTKKTCKHVTFSQVN